MSLTNHYLTLGIEYNASDEDIKQAFRRLAKRFHPDKNPGKEQIAAKRFRQVTAAYEILSNHESRIKYDHTLTINNSKTQYSQRVNLRQKARQNIIHLCQLMLFELLNQNSQSALEIYEELKAGRPHFNLDQYMSDGDSRDCDFLLAEAYHHRGRLLDAARLYENVLEKERRKPYFHRFAQEIKLMLRDVYLHYMTAADRPEDVLTNMNKILSLNIPKREIAWIYKKAAEAYYKTEDMDSAREALKFALQLNPKLTGAKKISRKLA